MRKRESAFMENSVDHVTVRQNSPDRDFGTKSNKTNQNLCNVWIIRIIILLSLILGSIYLLNGFPTVTGNTIIAQQDIPQNDSRVIGSLFIAQSFLLTILSRNRERKGQAAMEFLLTYGWVILAGLIALGVFIYIFSFNTNPLPTK